MADTTWKNYRKDKTRLLEQGVWFCLSCETTKSVTEFYKSASKSWPNSHCKKCQNQKQREVGKKSTLKYLYNISMDEYNRMLIEQNNCCAVCKRHKTAFKKSLSVDHDHKCCSGNRSCGRCVRGLLCHHCNWLLGKFKDDIERMRSAILYLEK